ncbi:hypothetical protein CbuK_1797 [Coxiella burnetii CbuK_Q154]|nr:hypothetical protein CbuK_1797 [Coxiella burnetii CbuK_Q154]AIT64005.1 hypothetical protein CBNA_1796 [Coxiella burnetii str. Namibia]
MPDLVVPSRNDVKMLRMKFRLGSPESTQEF